LRVRGKGGKEREVPIPDRLCAPLACLLGYGAKGRLFNISGDRIRAILREASFAAGIDPVTPHDLRRTYITRLLASASTWQPSNVSSGTAARKPPPGTIGATRTMPLPP